MFFKSITLQKLHMQSRYSLKVSSSLFFESYSNIKNSYPKKTERHHFHHQRYFGSYAQPDYRLRHTFAMPTAGVTQPYKMIRRFSSESSEFSLYCDSSKLLHAKINSIEKELDDNGNPGLVLEVLAVCSYLHSDHIPRSILEKWLQQRFPKSKKTTLILNKILDLLAKNSLITLEPRHISLHNLAQVAIRSQRQQKIGQPNSAQNSLEKWIYQVMENILVDFKEEHNDVSTNEEKQFVFLPHLMQLLFHFNNLKLNTQDQPIVVAHVALAIGDCLLRMSKPKQAKKHYEQALEIFMIHYGTIHHEIAVVFEKLANMYSDLAEPSKREIFLENALWVKEKYYGPCHYEVASTIGNFAIFHYDTGNPERSQPLLNRALDILDKLPANKQNFQLKQMLTNIKQKIVDDLMQWSRNSL